jgi:hypothetical protein
MMIGQNSVAVMLSSLKRTSKRATQSLSSSFEHSDQSGSQNHHEAKYEGNII